MIYEGGKVLDGTMQEIQAQYGDDTVRIRIGGQSGSDALGLLRELAGEVSIRDYGRYQELKGLEEPQAFLQALAGRASLEYFEITPPNLHDIFVRIARPTPEEAKETQGGPVT
jgi:ABC-2 type transport system ATP-binding protein